jgi:hypothetical protein
MRCKRLRHREKVSCAAILILFDFVITPRMCFDFFYVVLDYVFVKTNCKQGLILKMACLDYE